MALQVGQVAPDFSLPGLTGQDIKLADFRNQWVVLYFYPKDNTSGCTKEACDFQISHVEFRKNNAVVIGISKDSVCSHKKFADKYFLPFELLSDTDAKVCQLYDVWVEKSMYGRKYFGIERSTFLIDPKGEIRHVWSKVKVPGHVDAVLKALSSC